MMTDGVTLVTGATGFAGRHLIERLGEHASLVAWHRPGGSPPETMRRVKWQAVDITDQQSVKAAVRDAQPSQIFHLAGSPNVARSWTTSVSQLRVNTLGTHHVIEAVRSLPRSCRLLVVSSAQIYQTSDEPIREDAPLKPANPYGLSKLAQDQLALGAAYDDGLDIVVARPFNHIGPRQQTGFAVPSFASQIARIELGLAPPVIRVGNLESRRDITDVRDVVAAYERLMNGGRSGRPYNICSGRAWRIHDLLDELIHLTSVEIRVESDPDRFRPNDAPIVQGNASRIRAELGWAPAIRVEQTLRDTLTWWRTEIQAGRSTYA